MEVVDFDLVSSGGSIRVYVGHKGRAVKKDKILKQINLERKFGLFLNKTYINYYKR